MLRSLARTSEGFGLTSLAARLEELQVFMLADLAGVETKLDDLCATGSEPHLAKRAATHLLRQRGKRIRPVCVFLGARIGGAPIDESARELAVACELVHAATLLHDDVIDEGTERRGAPAARVVYGNSASILGGDYLLVEALDRVRKVGRPELLGSLLETLTRMVAAEATQLACRGVLEPSRERYLEIADGKTACLFRWALTAGAQLGHCSRDCEDALAELGTALGRAFQLIDDVLDLEGEPLETGKNLFADVQQGKLTWPVLVALEREPRILGVLEMVAKTGTLPPAELASFLDRVRATGATDETRRFARAEVERAKAALERLPECAARGALALVLDAAVGRRA
ncbi:MAG: polyprenyl synthetase family protein [Myxococcales bacterium]|nr:polyprenyl synthetase family protein [Myxococcales bacterium]